MSLSSIKTAAKNALSFPKAKRNDIVVVSVAHTYTDANLKIQRYTTYFLAKATSVSRDGRVTEFTRPQWGRPEMVTTRNTVMVISDADKQGAAKEIYATELGAMDFDDADQIKIAILDKAEALS